MARTLFAWEFGVNVGHLAQLLPLAVRLRARGHEPVFAMSDVTRAEAVLGNRGFDYLQAPVWQARSPRPMVIPCNYSELLQHYGYLDPEGLLGLVKAWREIYRLVDPQVILFEHAPTALLASRGFEAARILYGVGFGTPPRVTPFPNFRTWEDVAPTRLEASDARVLETVNTVVAKVGLRPLASLQELFDVDDDFLCTFAELDHYASRPNARYCGMMFARDEGARAEWPEGGDKRVFVNLRLEMRAFHPVAEDLSDSGHSVLWSAPGVSDELVRRYEKGRIKFVREPVRLADVTGSADVAVLPGGHGAVSAMLLAGVPMALYPGRVEHLLVTRNVSQIGAGAMASPRATIPELRGPLAAVLGDASYKDRAGAFAAKYADHDPKSVVARIARRIGAHCEQRGEVH